MDEIRGANAILTGASRGIGTYIASTLAARGVNLALAARSPEGLETARRDAEARGVRAIAVACDVTSPADRRRLVETSERELGQVDILINNAGVQSTAALTDLTDDEIEGILQTNLHASIALTKMVLPGMLERRRGAVVNMASMAGKAGLAYESIYSATKFGLVGFSEAVRHELAGTGVTISAVCPTFVGNAGMWADADAGHAPLLAREVSPEKVAKAVLKAIKGSPEVLVTTGPIRPLLAMLDLAPSLRVPLLRSMGVTGVWKRVAERRRAEARGELPVPATRE